MSKVKEKKKWVNQIRKPLLFHKGYFNAVKRNSDYNNFMVVSFQFESSDSTQINEIKRTIKKEMVMKSWITGVGLI